MKNRTKVIIILSCALGATLAVALGACAGDKTRESTLNRLVKQGKNVIVYYEKNGGIFAGRENIDFFDAFSYDQVKTASESTLGGVRLLPPGDARRDGGVSGGNNAITSTVERSGYTLIGWYRSVEERVDDEGNPLDDEGNLCYIADPITGELLSEAGKPQAYSYQGRWDFENDRLSVGDLQPDQDAGKEVQAIHLYAAWAPNYIYEFYRETDAGWEVYGTATKPVALDSIAVPHWDETKGSINYESVPRYAVEEDAESGREAESFTITGLYADPECTQPYAEYEGGGKLYERTIPHHGLTDLESGTATGTTVKLYTTWKEGNWFRIATAQQLSDNASPDGCYEILSDLDFAGVMWNFSSYVFTGQFIGNGHTISNITSQQTDATTSNNAVIAHGGLFGRFTSKAFLKDISFDNVSYTITAGARANRLLPDRAMGNFGLFAGAIDTGEEEGTEAVTAENLEGVKIGGKIYVGGRELIRLSGGKQGAEITSFTVGLIAGNVFGEEALALGIDCNVTAEAAIYVYDQDDFARSIYGKELEVFADSATYGLVHVSVLPEPITILL